MKLFADSTLRAFLFLEWLVVVTIAVYLSERDSPLPLPILLLRDLSEDLDVSACVAKKCLALI